GRGLRTAKCDFWDALTAGGSGAAGNTCLIRTEAACSPTRGMCGAIPACSTAFPCSTSSGAPLTASITLPTCRTSSARRPVFDDGPPLLWADTASGEQRAACVYTPSGAGATSLRPLVVFLPGAYGSADGVYDDTSLRAKAPTFDLSKDAARPGFVL